MVKRALLFITFLSLTACAGSPYEEGKSPADIPSHISVVRLKDVYITSSGPSDPNAAPNSDPARDPEPSPNDQEVAKIARASIVNQLVNFGYMVAEDDNRRADIAMKFFVTYQPERWPLINRYVVISGRVYDTAGAPLFTMAGQRQNSLGLIGAVVGDSRDEMVSDASRKAVINIVNELRKGTKE